MKPSLRKRVATAAAVLMGRQLEAASYGPRWSAGSMLRNPQAHIAAGSETVAARANGYGLNNPYGRQIVEIIASSLVGEDGPRPQSLHPDRAIARELERLWRRWERRCGLNGENLADTLRLALASFVLSGDGFVLLTLDEGDGLRLVVLDPEQVDRSKTVELGGGARIAQGVEYDAAGRIVAYWIMPDRSAMTFAMEPARAVMASEVLHLHKPIAPGQVRGLSTFSPILTRLAEIDSIEDAQLARIKVAALFAGFITDQGDAAIDLQGDRSGSELESGLEPGVLKVLRPGQGIEFPNTPQVGDAMDFLKTQLRAVAAGAGVTYQQLTGDLSDTNYSSIRAGLLEHRRRMGALQRQMIEPRFLDPIWRRFIMTQAFNGRISAAAFEADPEAFLEVEWLWPAWPSIDPMKETEADAAAVAAGFKSRREVISGRGRDPDAVAEEIAREGPLPAIPAKPARSDTTNDA